MQFLGHMIGAVLILEETVETIVQSDCAILHSHQQLSVPVIPHPHRFLVESVFLIQDVLIGE